MFTDKLQYASIIFVHGLFGHPKNTWTARPPRDTQRQKSIVDHSTIPPRKKLKIGSQELFDEIFWPRDLLPTEIPTARIITWGYDVRIESLLTETSKATVFQHAETLLGDLAMLRPSPTALPIIFVAHSLGGIVVKDALSLSKQEATDLKNILPATIGVAFLGTPHRGSKTASLGKIAFELSRLLLQNPNIKILRALEGQSEILDRISRSFAQILASNDNIQVHSFQEDFDTKGMSIVDASSSTIGCGRETRSGLHANHRNMAKYASAGEINFQRVSSVLRRWVEPFSAPRTSSNEMSALCNDVGEGPADISDGEYEQLLEALNFPAARSRFENVEAVYTDTYTWIYEDRLGFKAWLQGQDPRPIFWISGKPGSGKSTLMKHALTEGLTGLYLREYSQIRWIVTSFFFHDRGSKVQKTMEGFLCEVLYQLLVQRRDLFHFVHPILGVWCAQKDPQLPTFRDIVKLRRALLAITRNSASPLNCCVFVDALDEHLGNHRELILFLKDLACQDWTSNFRLRLCVASRPENIFMDALHDYPGFAIHDYTRADIRRYAAGRLRDEQLVNLDEQQEETTDRLVGQIEEKSDGVFMWVRLVVNELVEGLCEGDTLGELEALLSEIPTELSDLYGRAIRRHPLRSGRLSAKHRDEAYLMFHMVGIAQLPIPLTHLIRATLFLNREEHSGAEVDEMSQESMRRRLNSRSCGLLEVIEWNAEEPDWEGEIDSNEEIDSDEIESDEESDSIKAIDSDRGSDNLSVQFIHQTAKEFVLSKEGASIVEEGITLAESGSVLIFRYILKQLESCSEWAMNSFSDFADILRRSSTPVGALIQPTMKNIPKSVLIFIIRMSSIRGMRTDKNNLSLFGGDDILLTRSNIALWMIIYTLLGLPHSLRISIEMHLDIIDAELSVMLLEAGLRSRYMDCFPTLLEAGVADHLTAESFKEIDDLLRGRWMVKYHNAVSRSDQGRLNQLWISKTTQFHTASGRTDTPEGKAVSGNSDLEN